VSDFKAKMHKIRFLLGALPQLDPAVGAYSALSHPLAGFNVGLLLWGERGKRGKGKGEMEWNRRGKLGEGKGKKETGQAPRYFGLEPSLAASMVSLRRVNGKVRTC